MKAYSVFEKDMRREHAEIVFHYSAAQAKVLGFRKAHGDFDCDYVDIRVQRLPSGDVFAAKVLDPQVVKDPAIFRELGWRSEDEHECACCGLTDFSDGENKDWAICPDCGNCGECGHDDDCGMKR